MHLEQISNRQRSPQRPQVWTGCCTEAAVWQNGVSCPFRFHRGATAAAANVSCLAPPRNLDLGSGTVRPALQIS